jgi:hypothetical protein
MSWLLAEYSSGDELIYSVQGKRVFTEPNPSRQRIQHEVSVSLLIRAHLIFISLVTVSRMCLRSPFCCVKQCIHTHSHTLMFRKALDRWDLETLTAFFCKDRVWTAAHYVMRFVDVARKQKLRSEKNPIERFQKFKPTLKRSRPERPRHTWRTTRYYTVNELMKGTKKDTERGLTKRS